MASDWQRVRDSFRYEIVPALIRDLWGGEPDSARLISRDYNIVYRFEAGGAGFYLRICHRVLHTLPEARQVMHFLRFLAAEKVPVGAPVASLNGEYIELLDGGYFGAAQREAPGVEMSQHLLDRSVYEAWGRSLGLLHAASRRYQPDPAIPYQFPSVQDFWKTIEPAIGAASRELQRVYAELTAWMERLPGHDYGLIHGDYRPGNVIWDGTTARTIDFDEPNRHWYIADVARALMELSDLPFAERRTYRDAFLAGYLGEHEIDAFWVGQLPQFCQHRGVLMHGWDLQEGGSGGGSLEWALRRVGW